LKILNLSRFASHRPKPLAWALEDPQSHFALGDIDIDNHSERISHEEITHYLPFPEQYYASLSKVLEVSDGETLPSLAFASSSLRSADESGLESTAKYRVANAMGDYWYNKAERLCPHGEYLESLDDVPHDYLNCKAFLGSP